MGILSLHYFLNYLYILLSGYSFTGSMILKGSNVKINTVLLLSIFFHGK
jgi:hypothetical protein